MEAGERVPDLWDMRLLHRHICNILDHVSEPPDDFSQLWLKDDFEVVHLIACELSSEGEMGGRPLEAKPRGWPPAVCDALRTLARLTEEFSRPWRWRPGKGFWGSPQLVIGPS